MSYTTWLPTLPPRPMAGPWCRLWLAAHGTLLDGQLARAKASVRAWGVADTPADALRYHGGDRGIPRLPVETDEGYRARLVAAWETWRTATSGACIQGQLVLYGLRGVTVVPGYQWPAPGSGWARFRVFISGWTASGEHLSGHFTSGAYLGPGLSIAPLLSGAFLSGASVSGTVTTPAVVATVRGLLRQWRAARDRVADAVFTWGGTISGAFVSGVPTGVGPGGHAPVSWRGTPYFV